MSLTPAAGQSTVRVLQTTVRTPQSSFSAANYRLETLQNQLFRVTAAEIQVNLWAFHSR